MFPNHLSHSCRLKIIRGGDGGVFNASFMVASLPSCASKIYMDIRASRRVFQTSMRGIHHSVCRGGGRQPPSVLLLHSVRATFRIIFHVLCTRRVRSYMKMALHAASPWWPDDDDDNTYRWGGGGNGGIIWVAWVYEQGGISRMYMGRSDSHVARCCQSGWCGGGVLFHVWVYIIDFIKKILICFNTYCEFQ